jgi:outer membrane biosynthesis protein TonB
MNARTLVLGTSLALAIAGCATQETAKPAAEPAPAPAPAPAPTPVEAPKPVAKPEPKPEPKKPTVVNLSSTGLF